MLSKKFIVITYFKAFNTVNFIWYILASTSTSKGTTVMTPPQTTFRLPTSTNVITSCMGNAVELECPTHLLINVLSAEYGHRLESPSTCESDFPDASLVPTCREDSLPVLKEICQDKNTCKVCIQTL